MKNVALISFKQTWTLWNAPIIENVKRGRRIPTYSRDTLGRASTQSCSWRASIAASSATDKSKNVGAVSDDSLCDPPDPSAVWSRTSRHSLARPHRGSPRVQTSIGISSMVTSSKLTFSVAAQPSFDAQVPFTVIFASPRSETKLTAQVTTASVYFLEYEHKHEVRRLP